MTNEEAVKMLTAFRKEDGITELFRELNSEVVDSQKELLDICIQALEKQIPKKPFETYDDDTCIYKHYECPTCGERQSRHASLVYCMSCGQAIDWSDSNEV